ncbi:MAG TPA: tetratricopeptide repeat protein [Elusimicrobiota bacterium]|jgi:tetratricopeptide (TPR) repeat protein|nr:tetratricopeptide repeat protein [Elusimicrobiota bacterium]
MTLAPIVLSLLFAGAPRAMEPAQLQSSLDAANQLYEQSRLEDAIKAYRSLLSSAPTNADLQYNLGNAYYRFAQPGSLGLAIACYERAFALRPRDSDIRHNLDFALRRAGESLVPPGMPTALFALFHIFSLPELAALHWLGFWLACLCACAFLLLPKRRAALLKPTLALAAFWAAAGAWWGVRVLAAPDNPGVILIQDAEVRSGPGESFPVSFKAPEGRLVSILNVNGKWMEIGVLKEGLKGWLSADSVEKI